MRAFIRNILLCVILAAVCCSCDNDFMPYDRNEMIVEGWIDAGGFPVVIVTRSLPVRLKGEAILLDDLADYVLRWAKVTVSDGDTSVILTGGANSRYVPGFIYTTGGLKGVAGKSYSLTVEMRGSVAAAVTTIPLFPPSVDSVVYHPLPNDDQNYEVTAFVRNNSERKEYFKSFYMIGPEERQYLSSFMGVVDDAVTDSVFSMPIIRGVTDLDKVDKNRYFPKDTLVRIKISSMDSVSYEIWKSYEDNARFGSSFMSSSIREVESNIRGGRGYWCGYNSFTTGFRTD